MHRSNTSKRKRRSMISSSNNMRHNNSNTGDNASNTLLTVRLVRGYSKKVLAKSSTEIRTSQLLKVHCHQLFSWFFNAYALARLYYGELE